MKTRSKKATFLAAVALGAAVLAGSALPSLAQSTTAQPQGTVQTTQPTANYSGWYGPNMWWPTTAGTPGTVPVAPQAPTTQPSTCWGCWGGCAGAHDPALDLLGLLGRLVVIENL